MKEKWLIAVDLDGTLFHTDHQISTRTLETIRKVVSLGYQLLVVTGRSSFSAAPRLSLLPESARLLCSNGAYEYDLLNKRIVWSKQIPAATSIQIQHTILNALPTASFGWETENGVNYEKQFIKEAGGAHTLEQGGLKERIGQQATLKLYVRTPEQQGATLANSVQALLIDEFEVTSSGAPFVEITASGTNKGTALEKIAIELGIDATQTIAFGDNQNDISMLQWAGISVAMGNATPELKSVANAHARSNAEDGVARYLEERFFE